MSYLGHNSDYPILAIQFLRLRINGHEELIIFFGRNCWFLSYHWHLIVSEFESGKIKKENNTLYI